VADEAFVKNFVGGGAIVNRTISFADKARPRTRSRGLWHSGKAPGNREG
jgi:hypothetical protein